MENTHCQRVPKLFQKEKPFQNNDLNDPTKVGQIKKFACDGIEFFCFEFVGIKFFNVFLWFSLYLDKF